MGAVYDGSIKIDTKVDLKGLEDAYERLENILKNSANAVGDFFGQFNSSADTAGNAVLKVAKGNENASNSVQDLADEYGDLDAIVQRAVDRMHESVSVTDGGALYGPIRIGVSKLATSTDDLADKMDNASVGIKESGDVAREATPKVDKLGKKAEEAGKKAKDSKKGFNSMQVAIGNLISKAVSKAISSLESLIEKTREYRTDLAKLETNAQLAGVGIDVVHDSMKYLSAVTGETDSNAEALSNLLNAGFKGDAFQQTMEALAGAAIRFSDTLKLESLADGLQETLATGKAMGQFAELLDRTGTSAEKFEKGLAQATKQGREHEYVLELLSKNGLPEVARAYREQHPELVAAAEAQWDFDQALSALGAAIEPAIVALLQFITPIVQVLALLIEMDPHLVIIISSMIMLAVVILQVVKVIVKLSELDNGIGKFFKTINTSGLKTVAIVLMVVATLIALAAIIAVIIGRGNQVESAMNSINNSIGQVGNSVNDAQNQMQHQGPRRGYAQGTQSATRGVAWVGEHGAEMVRFRGGEQVLTATQSRALISTQRGVRSGDTYGPVTISVDHLEDVQHLVRLEKEARMMQRMGYAGR